MKRSKNSKVRKFIIAATAFVALAVPATAQAADYTITAPYGNESVTNGDEAWVSKPQGWNVGPCAYIPLGLDVNWNPVDPDPTGNVIYQPHLHVDVSTWDVNSNKMGFYWMNWTSEVKHTTIDCDFIQYRDEVTYPMVWKTFTKTLTGIHATSRSHSKKCATAPDKTSSLRLYCWGGTYAQAKYHFALPSDARNIHRQITTTQGCCYWLGGRISRHWVGNTAIVRATGHNSVDVDSVKITYQHRVKTKVITSVKYTMHGYGAF